MTLEMRWGKNSRSLVATCALLLPTMTVAQESPIGVSTPIADEALLPISRGLSYWIQAELAENGFETVAVAGSASRLEILDTATRAGLAHVIVPRLRESAGQASIQLSLFAPDTSTLLAGSLAEAPIRDVGKSAANATQTLLGQLGAEASTVTPPLIDDLSSTTVALEAWSEGDLARAFRAVQGKLSPRAMAIREQLVEEARSGTAPASARARVLVAASDTMRAWKLVSKGAKAELLSPSPDIQTLLAVGEIKLAVDDSTVAGAYFRRVLEIDPTNPDAHTGLARAHEIAGEVAAARASLQHAADSAGHDTKALEALATLAESPDEAAAYWIEAGRRSANALRVERARTQLENAGNAARASQTLGELEESLGNPADALAAYQHARARGLESVEVLTGIGRNQRRLGQLEGAKTSLNEALRLTPTHGPAALELGTLHLEAGNPTQAVDLLRAAHTAAPQDNASNYTLALALRATGDTSEAMALLSGQFVSPTSQGLSVAAQISREQSDLTSAEVSLRQAIVLDMDDPDLREQLANVLETAGDDTAAAEQRAFATVFSTSATEDESNAIQRVRSVLSLDDLVISFSNKVSRAGDQKIALIDIGEPLDWKSRMLLIFYPRRPDFEMLSSGIESALEARFDHARIAPSDREALLHHIKQLRDFDSNLALDAESISTVNQILAVDGILIARVISPHRSTTESCGENAFGMKMRLLMGRDPDFVSALENFDCLDGGYSTYGTWNLPALAAYIFIFIFIGWPIARGWGSLRVQIKLPEKTKGFLSIHLTNGPDQVKRERIDRVSARERLHSTRRYDFFRRFTRHMAGRETTFKWIPARRAGPYYVTVGGPLLDALGEEIIGFFLEEQQVMVRRRALSNLVFDFTPKEAAVEVRVLKGGVPAPKARVAVAGDTTSLRYTQDGAAFLYLGLGQYTILVGSDGAAAQFPLTIHSLATAIPVQVDLEDPDGTIFHDCVEAVEPYLQNDLEGAARALESAGQTDAAHRIRANHLQSQGRGSEAAVEFQAAGKLEEAAELRAEESDFAASAALFEEVGEHDKAARAYREAGDWVEAARCYEIVYDYGNALECWREAEETEHELDMLEKLGECMDAAQLARELGDAERAISNLQLVDQRNPYFADACRIIAEISSASGDHDLAISKMEEGIETSGAASASVETLESYAKILEAAGRTQDAIAQYELIRRRDVSRTDVVTRIQELKIRVSDAEIAAKTSKSSDTSSDSGRYELLEEIGRGGMGVVHKARDKRLGRLIAIKYLPENMREHPSAIALFEREARAAAALNHNHIVTLFDAGTENGKFFITMELLEGRPLNDIVNRNGRISIRDTLKLGVQICSGLNYAHNQRIVHRDIKTANLFFTREQTVKIMDFGIAKSMEEVRRATTVVGGTPYYMSPEQASGESVDHRTDLYALGVTLFELLTSTLPFPDGDVTYRHCHEQPPDPREIHLEIPAELAQIVLKLLEKDRDARPASAREVAHGLAAIAKQSLR